MSGAAHSPLSPGLREGRSICRLAPTTSRRGAIAARTSSG